jgi:hypothetical protein
MVHLADVVDIYVRLVDRRTELPQEVILEVGEPETLSYGELQTLLGRLIHGGEWRTYRIPKTLAKVGAWLQETLPLGRPTFIKPWMIDLADEHFELDITGARTVVGWNPRHRLRDTLPSIVAALEGDPWAWYRENELTMPTWLAAIALEAASEEEVTVDRLQELRELIADMARTDVHHGVAP